MSEIKGRNVVVVGGTSGIGLAVARLATAAGANVLAVGRSPRSTDEAGAGDAGSLRFAAADIHDADALRGIFKEVGRIDHLACNATGAQRTLAPFLEQTPEQFSAAFGKFWGYANLIRTAAPFLGENASIVLTTGFPARRCFPGQVSLSCTGAAIEALARALAVELAPVRVNVVSPGIIDTDIYSALGSEKDEALAGMTRDFPLPRAGQPDEVAAAMLYLMGADYVTGTTMDVEGGLLLS